VHLRENLNERVQEVTRLFFSLVSKSVRLKYIAVILVIASVLLPANRLKADGPPVQWQKTFGGNGPDYGLSVQQTIDGGYIIAGYTYSFGAGHCDVYLIKTDSAGNEIWQKTFGGNGFDVGYSVQQTSDGGYIIAGDTTLYEWGPFCVYLIKTNSNGDEQWQKTFSSGSEVSEGLSVQQTADGGYIIAGGTYSFVEPPDSDVYLIKSDSAGNLQWQKTFGGSGSSHYGQSVQQTTDDGYIIVGETFSSATDNIDVYLIKTDSTGNEIWQKTFDRDYRDYGSSVQQTLDGGYIITGYTYSFGTGYCDVYLIKTDSAGNEIWQKTFSRNGGDSGTSVRQTADGGYIITGSTCSVEGNNEEVYLIKVDPNGNSQWQKTFSGGNGSEGSEGSSVQQTADGGYIIAGTTYWSADPYDSDVYLIKVAPEKQFMITFDDGPVPGNTENIVNTLKNIYVDSKPVIAGFFMVGCDSGCEDTGAPKPLLGWLAPWPFEWWRTKGSVHGNSEIVQYVVAAGHIIGNHTQHHMWFDWRPLSAQDVIDEITACDDELQSALNKTPEKIFRPPYFVDNLGVRTGAKMLNYQIIMGAGDNEDAATGDLGLGPLFPPSVLTVKKNAANLIQKWDKNYPCVLTFHDISPTTSDHIAEIIEYLQDEEGFTLVNFDPSRLPSRLTSLVRQVTDTIHQSEIATHTISLDSTVGTVTFGVSWEGSDLDLVLYKPEGTKIEPNSTLTDPNVKYLVGDTYESYTISDPNPGNWMMEISGVNVPAEEEKYTIRVEADSNMILSAFTDKPDYELNEDVNIVANLVNDENSVTSALVMAKIQCPNGSVDNLTLYDDGTHGDEDPNDGSYANIYNNTSLRGLYKITTSAIGELTGNQYERASSLTIMVGSIIYGKVDFGAYAVLADHWMAKNCTEPDWCDTADLDQNGDVDIFDLAVLAEYWLEGTTL
jgi:peptidoglycan/xylan/chitin deacetylase (PgdA/CDA1 family)